MIASAEWAGLTVTEGVANLFDKHTTNIGANPGADKARLTWRDPDP